MALKFKTIKIIPNIKIKTGIKFITPLIKYN